MARYVYPAIIEKEENDLYSVIFPDIDYGATCGKDLSDALFMANDFLSLALCHMEDNDLPAPSPTPVSAIRLEREQFVSLVPCDTIEYRETHDTRLVNKTVTIEAWLNRMAEKAHLNCSRLLRNAIKAELHIDG